MKIGTYYYPEQWPRHQWERDFDNIVKMGLQIVHMAEFAWFDLEPSPGEFKFEWLDHCMKLASDRKLDVILCTPTAAPPIWLSHNIPSTLPLPESGVPMRFGSRRHYNITSPEFFDATRRIVTAMANHFGNHPSIIGWQIDNEYNQVFDQSEATHAAFRKWLRKKYGDIKTLNHAWGNQFWTTYYTEFEQILMPGSRDPRYGNPHQMLDASRFWSSAFAAYNRIQVDILKPKIGSRFLTTNFMPFFLDADPGDMADDLTIMTWDSYPVTGLDKEIEDETHRLADPAGIGFVHDQMASYKNRWGLMELQPGQVNWSGSPTRLFPGTIRLWIWTAFAHGAEFVTTYRFRQPRFHIEMFHHGLMGTDGVTPLAGGREFATVIQEMKKLDLKRIPAFADEPKNPQQTVGIVFDFDQLWYYTSLPQAKRWNQPKFLTMWYAALSRLGVRIKILSPHAELPADLPLIVVPGLQMCDESFLLKAHAYAEQGGNLVLTCRTALMDRTGQFWEGPWASPILDLIGASIDGYDSLREGRFGQIQFQGTPHPWGIWGDQLTARPGTEVLATYSDQFYAGAAAITRRKQGKGTVSYFGAFSEQSLTDAFVQAMGKTVLAKQLHAQSLPTRVQILSRGPYRIALNYQDKPVKIDVPANAKFVIGSALLDPAGVAIWQE